MSEVLTRAAVDAPASDDRRTPSGQRVFEAWDSNPKIKLPMLGAEMPLPDVVSGLHDVLHSFATDVMRPIGRELDRSSAAEVIAEGSRLWEFREKYAALGIDMEAVAGFSPEELPIAFCVMFEELGWGDAGLAISAAADLLPHYMAAKFGNEFVAKTYPESLIGCWGITEPDHGSDSLDPTAAVFASNGVYGRPNCVAKITDGKVIIRGQKSAWVSNGPIAELCILYCAAETRDGGADPYRGAVVVVPLKELGVQKGPPLEKIGQRALPQSELFFDNIEVDIDHLLVAPEDYKKGVYSIHCEANAIMGAVFTGVARSAYELALQYSHERKQGGVPIIRHQDVAKRLFHMARKVEISRAISRRVITFNQSYDMPALQAAMFAKVTATQNSLEVANDAIQLHGGNGLTHAYLTEKIFRDARASLIEDGCNEVLSIKGGTMLVDEDML